jgi:hypothetical protein
LPSSAPDYIKLDSLSLLRGWEYIRSCTGNYTTVFQESIWRTLPRPPSPSKTERMKILPRAGIAGMLWLQMLTFALGVSGLTGLIE